MRDFAALIAFLEGRRTLPFAWGRGRNDCVSFAAGAAKATTGRDLLKGSGLRWSSARGAARTLRDLGGLEAAVDLFLPRTPAARAMRGDLGTVEGDDGPLLVVVEGDTLAGPGPDGLRRLPRAALATAWSVQGGGE